MKLGKGVCLCMAVVFLVSLAKPVHADDNTLKYAGVALALGSAGYAITSGESDNSMEFFEWKVIAAGGGVLAGWMMMMLSSDNAESVTSAEANIPKKRIMVGPLIVPRTGLYGISVGFTF